MASVESFYKAISQGCQDLNNFANSKRSGSQSATGVDDSFLFTDLRDVPDSVLGGVDVPGGTVPTWHNGKLCYLTFRNSDSAVSGAAKGAALILQSIFNSGAGNVFIRLQDVVIAQDTSHQIKQTFDGIYAGVYGGGLATIKLTGITNMWSGKAGVNGGEGNVSRAAPDAEMDAIVKVMMAMSNARGMVFNYHDGILTRKWGVIPYSLTISRSVGRNNQEVYEIVFKGAAMGSRFRHIEVPGSNLSVVNSHTAKFHTLDNKI